MLGGNRVERIIADRDLMTEQLAKLHQELTAKEQQKRQALRQVPRRQSLLSKHTKLTKSGRMVVGNGAKHATAGAGEHSNRPSRPANAEPRRDGDRTGGGKSLTLHSLRVLDRLLIVM